MNRVRSLCLMVVASMSMFGAVSKATDLEDAKAAFDTAWQAYQFNGLSAARETYHNREVSFLMMVEYLAEGVVIQGGDIIIAREQRVYAFNFEWNRVISSNPYDYSQTVPFGWEFTGNGERLTKRQMLEKTASRALAAYYHPMSESFVIGELNAARDLINEYLADCEVDIEAEDDDGLALLALIE